MSLRRILGFVMEMRPLFLNFLRKYDGSNGVAFVKILATFLIAKQNPVELNWIQPAFLKTPVRPAFCTSTAPTQFVYCLDVNTTGKI
jgi:hypothetical protein